MEAIGYIGAFLLAICALPQTIASLLSGNSYGLTYGFLWSWFLGEIFMAFYVMNTVGVNNPMFWNLAVNMCLLAPIVWYRHRPRGEG